MSRTAPTVDARCTVYRAGGEGRVERFDPAAVGDGDGLLHARESLRDGDFCWVSVTEPDGTFMRHVADVFGIHDLVVEDTVAAHQRPKLERYDSQLMFVLRTVNYTPGDAGNGFTPDVTTGEVQVILGADFVVTVGHGATPDPSERLTENLERVFLPQTVLYTLADEIVDHYLEVSLRLEDDVSAMETTVFAPAIGFSIEEIYLLMREVLEIRHAIDPLTVALKLLVTDHDHFVDDSRNYLRDVLDHQILAADRIGNYAERLTSLVDAAAAKISLQQNTDMRKMSAWAAVAVVPTLIAGIYGMNFERMPELGLSFGYPLVIAIMVLFCVSLIALFRHNRWL
ncbi:magnesium and cobalt transport protein CorA [uncultured Corynebacterium sp.]|uniref:magnesium and cobalt transport protein CorA n=1 Tax=uncultured Corynebacterium sp. TaxID=159447 RepID=UPI0025CDC78F|nr:magnesium and cobalt transport protein CorA [uncultured Corynebacterium sp.]